MTAARWVPLVIVLAGCRPPSPEVKVPRHFEVWTVVEAGGRVYADAVPSLSSGAVVPPHELAIIDPAHGFDTGAATIWDAGAVALGAKIDDSTLVGYERNPDADIRLHAISLATPTVPRLAATTILPDTTGFYVQTVTALPDGNVFVWVARAAMLGDATMPRGPLERGYVVDPRAQAVRSVTARLSCATVHLVGQRLYCANQEGILHVLSYSTAGGLGAELAFLTLPTTGHTVDSYLADERTLHVLAASALLVVALEDGPALTATVPAPSWPGRPIVLYRGLPLPGEKAALLTSAGLALYDAVRSVFLPTSFAGDETGLAAVPSRGPDHFLLGHDRDGLKLLRLVGDDVVAVGVFNGW